MENTLRYNRRRSGYEPSDTEIDSPSRDYIRNKSPLTRMPSTMEDPISVAAARRRQKSPYKPRGDDGNITDLPRNISPLRRTYSDMPGGYVSPFSKSERRINPNSNRENVANAFSNSERRRQVSPYKTHHDPAVMTINKWNNSNIRKEASAPRERLGQKNGNRTLSPLRQEVDNKDVSHKHFLSVGEINEMLANAKISRGSNNHAPNFESTDSFSPGDIFFSKDFTVFPKNDPTKYLPKPPGYVNRHFNHNNIPDMSRKNSSSVISSQSSHMSDSSGRTSASTRKFVENRKKRQADAWFFCMKKGSCKTSDKSPEKDRAFDEASFIGKAVVDESLRPLWADKHQPSSLIGFTCHKQEALLLQQLATSQIFPHILLKGPPGSGKKSLTMALLREIYGDPVWNISHELRYINILEMRPMQVVVPLSLSPHHVELNVYLEPKASYVLTALVKEISSEHAITPEMSTINMKQDYKVLVLYDVDKASENIHHLIKWIMDCYSDFCKLILCCEDDVDILESVKTRCKVVRVEAPVTNDVMEILIQIAKKEGFELSMSFAAKIATKSKQNLRRAIMALEACKAHSYPFAEEQPIPLGWEEALVELAADILADPLPKRLFIIRGKLQKLLADFVHPKLILLKLVEQFLEGVEASLKRELYYWYAYYDKRLPTGTSALLKLEEFVAKFMSIYRKGSSNRLSA